MLNLKTVSLLVLTLIVVAADTFSAEPIVLLEEKFDKPLSADWHWGLGTWTAKDGVLRGFESGERRHGPLKVHKLTMTNAGIIVLVRAHA